MAFSAVGVKLSKVRSSYNITIRRTATSVRVPEKMEPLPAAPDFSDVVEAGS